ncbi:MAG: hypothetical protein HQ567_34905 [Candidatus Nealsonbacteria bacterium]|nr:hypothetical protein [Candidatus Nealsonbacteria bacterium]
MRSTILRRFGRFSRTKVRNEHARQRGPKTRSLVVEPVEKRCLLSAVDLFSSLQAQNPLDGPLYDQSLTADAAWPQTDDPAVVIGASDKAVDIVPVAKAGQADDPANAQANVEFGYTITAEGTEDVTIYPNQNFQWTAEGEGTETWETYPDQHFTWTVTGTGTETWGVSMPGEGDPADYGFYQQGTTWYKDGRTVTGSGATEFRVVNGKPFWKSGTTYYYNSMTNYTSSAWGNRGTCTSSGATCFAVIGGKVFYKSGTTYYYNNLSTYTFAGSFWGHDGACTSAGATEVRIIRGDVFYKSGTTYHYNNLSTYTFAGSFWGHDGTCTSSGATEFQIIGGKVFYKSGTTYRYNSLSTYTFAGSFWGRDGNCTHSGATEFRVSGRKPYWKLGNSYYMNTLSTFTFAGSYWGSMTSASSPLPDADTPDSGYDPCGFGVRTAIRTATDSGSGVVNGTEGNKFISNFNAYPQPQNGGMISGVSYSISDNSPAVSTSISGTSVYAATNATQPQSAVRKATDSDLGTVNALEGNKDFGTFSAYPEPQQGGTISDVSYNVQSNNPNVNTWLGGSHVYGNTDYSVVETKDWADSEQGNAVIPTTPGDVFVITSSLVAPNGDTTWRVEDDHDQVDTWMVGANLWARHTGPFPGEVRGHKWHDLNGSGAWEAGEPGLQGWSVYLDTNDNRQRDDGELFDTTDANGDYAILDVPPGTYVAVEESQAGWMQTSPADGHSVTITDRDVIDNVDFGNFQYGAVSGLKYSDLDGNGTQDASEPGLDGWVVYADVDGDGLRDADEPFDVTSNGGVYAITNLPPGLYPIHEQPQPNWIQTAPPGGLHPLLVFSGAIFPSLDFGNHLPLDFGDAPSPYPTLLADNGARHVIVLGFHLGAAVDEESDGQPSPAANGDDNSGIDDEDGVDFTSQLTREGTATVDVAASVAGKLDAWIDFNRDGDWLDPGEHVFDNVSLDVGVNGLDFPVPAGARPGQTYARFRLSSAGGLSLDGPADDGEVEDHRVIVQGGGQLLYEGSAFDSGELEDKELADDDAVATDKIALLPGETASFANYTSYHRGINGLMVDVPGGGETPAAKDFVFKVGNDNNPDDWDEAPVPTSVTVRPNEGIGGFDRVTILWPDHAIQNQWLQVTVLVTDNTGLEEQDVFYFGNAVAEAGDSTTDARVTIADLLLARNNPRDFLTPAAMTFPYDFDRDGHVNASDVLLARNNQTSFLNALRLIDLGEVAEIGGERLGARGEGEEALLGQLAWLAEQGLDRAGTSDRNSTAQEAVDLLLGACWP